MLYSPTRLEWHLGDRGESFNPAEYCVVLSDDKRTFDSPQSLVVALAKSQDHRAFCGVFAFGGQKDRKPKLVANEVRLRTQPRQTGHRQTAFKAAVTVLRGNGGTVPSQAQMSDPQGGAGTGRQDALRRVILPVVQSVKHNPMYVPDSSEICMVLTNLVSTRLGEYLPIRTRLN